MSRHRGSTKGHSALKEMQMVTAEEIEAARSEAGGWTKETLAAWNVPWPPPKGWKADLIAGNTDFGSLTDCSCEFTEREQKWAESLCEKLYMEPAQMVGCPAHPRWHCFLESARRAIATKDELEP